MAKLTKVERARRKRIKAGKALPSDIHTSQWWSKRYREAKKYAREKGIVLPYASRKEYISSYLGLKPAAGSEAGTTVRHTAQYFDFQYQKMRDYAAKKGLTFPYINKSEFISDYKTIKSSGVKRPLDEMRYFLSHKTSYKVALSEYRKSKEAREEWIKRKEEHQARVDAYVSSQEQREDIEDRMDSGEIIDQDELDAIPEDPGEFEEEEPPAYRLRDLQDMTTQEFAEENKDLLRNEYHKRREEGLSSKQAKEWVSTEYFGSP